MGLITCESVKAAPQAVEVKYWRAREKGPKRSEGKKVRGQAGQGGPRTSRPSHPVGRASAATLLTLLGLHGLSSST